jgi:outer membrane protein OmpA-like peptidoglycan-associated protein
MPTSELPDVPDLTTPSTDAPAIAMPEDAPPIPDAAQPLGEPDAPLPAPDMDAPTPPVPDALPVPPVSPAPAEEEGLFPNLKRKFLGFIGKDEPPAVTPSMDEALLRAPEPMTAPAEEPMPEMASPEPMPAEPEMATLPDGLPALPDIPDTGFTPPALPDLGEAPVKNNTNEALDIVRRQQTRSADGLPPLPGVTPPPPPSEMPELPDAVPPEPEVNTAIEQVIEKDIAALPPAPGLPKPPASPSANEQKGEKVLSVEFAMSEMEVPITAQSGLKDLARRLASEKEKNVTVVAFASAPEEQSSLARRVSLARALAVRAFLIDLGVDNIRINIQPLGNNVPEGGGSTERADIFIK